MVKDFFTSLKIGDRTYKSCSIKDVHGHEQMLFFNKDNNPRQILISRASKLVATLLREENNKDDHDFGSDRVSGRVYYQRKHVAQVYVQTGQQTVSLYIQKKNVGDLRYSETKAKFSEWKSRLQRNIGTEDLETSDWEYCV